MAGRMWTQESFKLERNTVSLYLRLAFGAAEVDQATFATLLLSGDGDYFVVHDWKGGSWAVALDTTGGAASTPTGAAWVAVPAANKVYYNISGATTGSDVSALVHTALLALTGFTAVLTAATSTTHQNITSIMAGVVTAPNVYSKSGAAGTGSITKSVTTAGTTAVTFVTGSTATGSKNLNEGILSATMVSPGVLTVVFGGPQASSLDTYNRLFNVTACWDAIANSGTAPATPLVYVTGNSVATAGTASCQLTFNNTSQAAANPAALEHLRLRFVLCNSPLGQPLSGS